MSSGSVHFDEMCSFMKSDYLNDCKPLKITQGSTECFCWWKNQMSPPPGNRESPYVLFLSQHFSENSLSPLFSRLEITIMDSLLLKGKNVHDKIEKYLV